MKHGPIRKDLIPVMTILIFGIIQKSDPFKGVAFLYSNY